MHELEQQSQPVAIHGGQQMQNICVGSVLSKTYSFQ